MKQTTRLCIPYREGAKMEEVLREGMETIQISMADIWTKGERETHFGNWVLVPVANNEASKTLAKHFNNDLDMFGFVLEETDLQEMKEGDRVKVWAWGMFAPVNGEGKILRFENDRKTVVILAKGKRTKGWKISVGDEAGVWKL